MKKIILAMALLTMSKSLSAQGLQAGIRTGAGINYQVYDMQERKDYSWVNQLSIRYETKKKLAFELGFEHNYTAFNHTPNDNHRVYFESSFAPPSIQELSRKVQMNRLALNLVAQYDITCPALQQKCPLLKRFKNYIGIQISPSRTLYTEDSRLLDLRDNRTITDNRYRYSFYDISIGFSNTMKYSVSTKLDVVANISILMGTGGFGSAYSDASWTYRANTLVNKTIGVNYRIFHN